MVRVVALNVGMIAGIAGAAVAAGSSMLSPAPAQLAAMPNTTVRFYDVSGRNVTEINRSIARQRPKGRDGKPIPATLDWAVMADFERTAVDGVCKVSSARATYRATAELPRLVDVEKLDKSVLIRWRNYVDQLEEGSLATVAFIHQNLGEIEKAMLGSSCDRAKAAGAAAIEQIRLRTELLDADREKRLRQQNASLSEFRPAESRMQKKVCKDITLTESRVRTFRFCMTAREWAKQAEIGEATTKELQNKPRTNRPF